MKTDQFIKPERIAEGKYGGQFSFGSKRRVYIWQTGPDFFIFP